MKRAAGSFDWKPYAIVTKAADRSALAHSENYRICNVDIPVMPPNKFELAQSYDGEIARLTMPPELLATVDA